LFDEGFDTQDSSPRDAVILLCHARCVLVSELLTAWRGALVTRQIVVVNYGRQQFLSEAASEKKKVLSEEHQISLQKYPSRRPTHGVRNR